MADEHGSMRQVDRLLAAVEDIACSPRVHDYVLGYTAQACDQRGRQYRGKGFSHLVILADKMTSDEALNLEAALHEALSTRTDKDSVLYRKWHHEKKKDVYRRNAGGVAKYPEEPIHSVYMAWCAPEE